MDEPNEPPTAVADKKKDAEDRSYSGESENERKRSPSRGLGVTPSSRRRATRDESSTSDIDNVTVSGEKTVSTSGIQDTRWSLGYAGCDGEIDENKEPHMQASVYNTQARRFQNGRGTRAENSSNQELRQGGHSARETNGSIRDNASTRKRWFWLVCRVTPLFQ